MAALYIPDRKTLDWLVRELQIMQNASHTDADWTDLPVTERPGLVLDLFGEVRA